MVLYSSSSSVGSTLVLDRMFSNKNRPKLKSHLMPQVLYDKTKYAFPMYKTIDIYMESYSCLK